MEQDPNTSLFEMKFDEEGKEQLRGLSRWTLIIVVTSVISMIIGLIQAFTIKQKLSYGDVTMESSRSTNVASAVIGVLIGGLLAYLLYQFSANTKRGVDTMNQADLNRGLGSLRAYFMTYGILIIIILVVVVLLILVSSFAKL